MQRRRAWPLVCSFEIGRWLDNRVAPGPGWPAAANEVSQRIDQGGVVASGVLVRIDLRMEPGKRSSEPRVPDRVKARAYRRPLRQEDFNAFVPAERRSIHGQENVRVEQRIG